jgi:hypothetical protein
MKFTIASTHIIFLINLKYYVQYVCNYLISWRNLWKRERERQRERVGKREKRLNVGSGEKPDEWDKFK